MRPVLRFHLPRLLAPLLLLCAAGLAHAQYSWIDERGIRHLSDRPPPPGTPANQILKAPNQAGVAARQVAVPEAPAPAPAHRELPRGPTLEQRETEFLKGVQMTSPRTAGMSEQAKQNYCKLARNWKEWLTSGAPKYQTGVGGKRDSLSNEELAEHVARADAALEGCP
jgi:hypothetical protein